MTATVTTFRRVITADIDEVRVDVDVAVVGQLKEGDGIVLELVEPSGDRVRLLGQIRGIQRSTVNLDPKGSLRIKLEEIVEDSAVAR